MDKVKSFGERMKEIRELKGCSLQDISNVVGISKQALSRYENDERSPKRPAIESLARYFNVSIVWLMGYDVDAKPPVSSTKERMANLTIKLEGLSTEEQNKILRHFEDTINLLCE